MNKKFRKERTVRGIIGYAKTHGQWTLREITFSLGLCSDYANFLVSQLVEQERLYKVGTDNANRAYFNIKDWFFIEPVKKRQLMRVAPKDRPMIERLDIFKGMKANVDAVDRFYRGTKCASR